METVLIVLGVFVALPLLMFVVMYNGLVALRNRVRESWSDVDTELKRRYDLIPNLVETVKGYAAHEKAVLEGITEARTRALASTGTPSSQAADEKPLVGALKSLFAVVENYPELKANANFLALQGELVETEDRIQAARRFYNANVRDYNIRCESIPTNIIANLFHFERADFFEVESADIRKPVKVSL